jgi:hypothetical protein
MENNVLDSVPENCECDNTHENAKTVCRVCYDAGFRYETAWWNRYYILAFLDGAWRIVNPEFVDKEKAILYHEFFGKLGVKSKIVKECFLEELC